MKGWIESRDVIIPGYLDQLDNLASKFIEEVNRIHTRGVGLTGYSSVVSDNSVHNPDDSLNDTGLIFTPIAGSFDFSVVDGDGNVTTTTINLLNGVTDSLNDLAGVLDGIDNVSATVVEGRLEINADAGYSFSFSNDTSDTLLALGINTFFQGQNSRDIALASIIADDVNMIAAAADYLSLPGDNSIALEIAGLQNEILLEGSTLGDYYGSFIGKIGIDSQNAENGLDHQEMMLDQLNNRRDTISGVSLDEEMTDLIKYERAFQSAAKLIAMVDEMLDTIVNRM